MSQEKKTVKCKDCGFLALQDYLSRELVEADAQYRNEGRSALRSGTDGLRSVTYSLSPICLMRVADFGQVIGGQGESKIQFKLINEERHCDLYRKWEQGFSAKEHRQMVIAEKLMDRQADVDEKRDSDNARRHKQMVIIQVVGFGILILATALGSYLNGMFQGQPTINVTPAPITVQQSPAPVVNVQLPEPKPTPPTDSKKD